ncbi:ankyrin repeat domain-containing protein [Thiolinea disciformis]|uniref:ankyrin repeat domain-containing protein n=1 Tax=Thiolinea disciformis TaxID=125614 RepID=UPI000366F416|nr:ankyrin repeat domain-containing protein [Thiolinea disciformis]
MKNNLTRPAGSLLFAEIFIRRMTRLSILLIGLASLLPSLSHAANEDAKLQAQEWRRIAAEATQAGDTQQASQALAAAKQWEQLAQDAKGGAANPAAGNTDGNGANKSATPSPPVDDKAARLRDGLQQAISDGDYNRAKGFINQGAQPTPEMVQLAVDGGYTGIAYLLSKSGAALDGGVLGRALLKAANAQDQERIKNLLKLGANVNYSENGVTAMSIAARQNNMGMISLLLSQGAQRDPTELGRMLFQAVEQGERDRAQNLIKMGANANYAQDGMTCLSRALDRNDFGMVSALIAGGAAADPAVLGKALFQAVEQDEREKVSSLIKLKADVNFSANGVTPLTVAINNSNLALANLLVQAGATDPSGRFGKKTFDAALEGDTAWLSILAKVPSYANYRNAEGETPLHAAASTGQTEAVAILLRAGVDPNILTVKNWTPLHHAARFGHQLPVMHLLKAGSDIYAVNSDGYDAYKLATLAPRDTKNDIDSSGVLNYLKLWMSHHPRPQ